MESLTCYHDKLQELSRELISHGWGKFIFEVSTMKDNKTKVEISCGKKYVYFIKKDVIENTENIF